MTQIYYLELTNDALPLDSLDGQVVDAATSVATAADIRPPGPGYEVFITLESGLWVSVSVPTFSGRDHFVDDFGMERAAAVEIQLNLRSEIDPQMDSIIPIALEVLRRVSGDAVFHYEYSSVFFVRRGGKLYVSDDEDTWIAHDLSQIDQPYERCPLAFPE